jgi:hypothetical protein
MRWPTRYELDTAAPHNPVYIRPIWGYWRGTVPLSPCQHRGARRAGITRDTVAPLPSVTIERTATAIDRRVFEEEFAPRWLIWLRDAESLPRPTGCAARCSGLSPSAPPAFRRPWRRRQLLRTYRWPIMPAPDDAFDPAPSANWRRRALRRSVLCRSLARLAASPASATTCSK